MDDPLRVITKTTSDPVPDCEFPDPACCQLMLVGCVDMAIHRRNDDYPLTTDN
jgi:hypothetical protein